MINVPFMGLPAMFCIWNGSDLRFVISHTWRFPLGVEKKMVLGWVIDQAAQVNCSSFAKCKITGLFCCKKRMIMLICTIKHFDLEFMFQFVFKYFRQYYLLLQMLTSRPSFQMAKLYPPTVSRRCSIQGHFAMCLTGPSCTEVIHSIVHTAK